jgi:hypothetical protein
LLSGGTSKETFVIASAQSRHRQELRRKTGQNIDAAGDHPAATRKRVIRPDCCP